jgi:hypothetical protein
MTAIQLVYITTGDKAEAKQIGMPLHRLFAGDGRVRTVFGVDT